MPQITALSEQIVSGKIQTSWGIYVHKGIMREMISKQIKIFSNKSVDVK